MSIILNGTAGLTNDATDLNYTGTLTGGTGVVNLGSGQLVKDAFGNLGLGVTPSAWTTSFSVRALQFGGGSVYSYDNNRIFVGQNVAITGSGADTYLNTAAASTYRQFQGAHNWYTAPFGTAGNAISFTHAMTLDSSGNLLMGTTSTAYAPAGGGAINAKVYAARSGLTGSFSGNGFNINWTGSNSQLWIDQTNLGTIQISSDYRIKRNIESQTTPALARVMQLRPVTYKMADYGTLFQSSEDIKEGFIAHELQAIIPSAVEGKKDTENQIQSLKLDALCSVLTKGIQEQQAIIESLTARITALEAK